MTSPPAPGDKGCNTTASLTVKLYHGVRNGTIVDIADVERGRACGCICAHCKQPLVAKKGQIRRHHFAHDSGSECAWGLETTLHRLAKEVLERAGQLWIPAVTLELANKRAQLKDARYILLDRVTLEAHAGGFVPDVIAESQGTPLIVEIKVTHGVDDTKLAKIKEGGVSALEIDLSRTARNATIEELTPLIVGKSQHKRWLHSELATRSFTNLKARSNQLRYVHRGLALHVDGCPIAVRRWRGKPYANVIDDCLYCQHSIAVDEPNVYCLAPAIPPGVSSKAGQGRE